MNRSKKALVGCLLVLPVFSISQVCYAKGSPGAAVAKPAPANGDAKGPVNQGVTFPHAILDRALAGKVNNEGMVDYAALKGDDFLAKYVELVAAADLTQFPDWTLPPQGDEADSKDYKPKKDRSVETAFWINAYNALMLKTISDNYPISTVGEIKEFDSAKTHIVGGVSYSFAEMRKKIGGLDPRAIFAIIDGTRSGPRLSPEAYRFRDLTNVLDAVAVLFVNDEQNVKVDRIANKVTVNDYLLLCDGLFVPATTKKKNAGIRYVLQNYTDPKNSRGYLTTGEYQLLFIPHDPKLNLQQR